MTTFANLTVTNCESGLREFCKVPKLEKKKFENRKFKIIFYFVRLVRKDEVRKEKVRNDKGHICFRTHFKVTNKI